jgi:CubicO group peptidase (beta-lactamase class C family)
VAGGLSPPVLGADSRVAGSLQPFVDGSKLAGAVVLVADHEKVLTLETVGFADLEARKPMRPDTLFWIASQSKPITATALMMLVDEGKVRLDDPVEEYLPEFRDQWLAVERDQRHVLLQRPKQRVTVRHLLSHTSGLPFSSELEHPTLDGLPLRVAAGSYAMTPIQWEPGTKYQYSNAGINTAGRIIEVVAGMPYEVFLEKRLFGPLGMKDTTFRPNAEQVVRLAKSYRPKAEGKGLEEIPITQLRYPLDDPTRQPMPAGGLFSTAGDVGRFCRMILAGGTYNGKRYLSESSVREMTSRQTATGIEEDYGLGWATGADRPASNGPIIPGPCGHGGAYATSMSIDPRRDLITVYMVHYAGPGGDAPRSAFVEAAEKAFGRKLRHRRHHDRLHRRVESRPSCAPTALPRRTSGTLRGSFANIASGFDE